MDLISRQAAIDYCYALINAENPSDPSDEWNYSQERISQTEVILHHLEFMPSAQPEIIFCKDCKHKPILDEDDEPEFPTSRCPCQCEDSYYSWMPKDDWFCANAERREE